jgi:hypothetical protein
MFNCFVLKSTWLKINFDERRNKWIFVSLTKWSMLKANEYTMMNSTSIKSHRQINKTRDRKIETVHTNMNYSIKEKNWNLFSKRIPRSRYLHGWKWKLKVWIERNERVINEIMIWVVWRFDEDRASAPAGTTQLLLSSSLPSSSFFSFILFFIYFLRLKDIKRNY